VLGVVAAEVAVGVFKSDDVVGATVVVGTVVMIGIVVVAIVVVVVVVDVVAVVVVVGAGNSSSTSVAGVGATV
jgi:hypothetical protein